MVPASTLLVAPSSGASGTSDPQIAVLLSLRTPSSAFASGTGKVTQTVDWTALQQFDVLLSDLLDLAKLHELQPDGLIRLAQSQTMQTMLDGIVLEVSNQYSH